MSIERAEKNFDYIDSSGNKVRKKIISPGAPWGMQVNNLPNNSITCNFEDLKTETAANNGCFMSFGHPIMTSNLVWEEYYFGIKDAISFGEKIVQGTGKTAEDYIDMIMNDINDFLVTNQPSTDIQSYNFSKYCAKEQGMYGWDNSFTHPEFNIYIRDNTFNISTLKRTASININFHLCGPGIFDETTGKWPPTPRQQIFTVGSIGTYNSQYLKIALQRLFSSMNNLYIKPSAGFGVIYAPNTFVKGSDFPLNVWWWGFFKSDSYFSAQAQCFDMLLPFTGLVAPMYAAASMGGNWNASGTVDPEDPEIEPDPYDPIPPGPNPPGPVDPTDPEDPVPEPGFPPINGAIGGVYKAYCPNSSQLQLITGKLWDPDAWTAIKQMFTNPMDAIFGLAIVPVNPVTSNSEYVYLGRYNTQVSVPRISSDYVNVDCGSVTIPKFYNSYLDFDPYTKYSLHLPYIGEMDLNADEITGHTLHIKYHCNVITGDCVALVMIDNRVCYTGMGNFIRQLPLSQTDFSSIIQTAVTAASTILTAAVAGAGGASVAGSLVSAEASDVAVQRAQNQVSSSLTNGATSLISEVMSAKFQYKHSGKIGQGAGQLSVQKPFITVIRPNLALPEGNNNSQQSNLKAYTGYPCNKISNIGSYHGFTQIEACKLSIPDATDAEIAEIYESLKGGVLV